jgi:hypothetical protein
MSLVIWIHSILENHCIIIVSIDIFAGKKTRKKYNSTQTQQNKQKFIFSLIVTIFIILNAITKFVVFPLLRGCSVVWWSRNGAMNIQRENLFKILKIPTTQNHLCVKTIEIENEFIKFLVIFFYDKNHRKLQWTYIGRNNWTGI